MKDDVLYRKSYLKRYGELAKINPALAEKFMTFDVAALSDGHISAKTKELIAIACAHVTGCPYCIDVHVNKYKKMGGTMEEIIEAVMVAAALKAGAAVSHSLNALNAFEGE